MTTFGIEVEGIEALTKQLGALTGDADGAVLDVITELAIDTQEKAVDGIQQGPATGIVYEKYKPRRTHTASAFGEFPASDTGQLAASIAIQMPTESNLVGKVGTDLMHGFYLEFGTSDMSHRQWLTPSFEEAKIGISKKLKAEIERLIKRV